MNCVENWRCALLMYFITWTVAQHKSLQMGLCGITVFQSDETSVWARYSSKSKKIHYRRMFKLPDVKVLINHVQSWARANNRRVSFWESMSAPSICVTEREVAAFLVKLHSASPRFTPPSLTACRSYGIFINLCYPRTKWAREQPGWPANAPEEGTWLQHPPMTLSHSPVAEVFGELWPAPLEAALIEAHCFQRST